MNAPMPSTAPQKKSKLPALLIGCGVLFVVALPVCGILSAIAIPAFLRSVKKSKTAESTMNLARVSTYAQGEWALNCQFPPVLSPTGDPTASCGGGKNIPNLDGVEDGEFIQLFSDPSYFIYTTKLSVEGDDTIYSVRAQADFDCTSPEIHTTEVRIIGRKNGDVCTAEVMPALTTHEFE